MLWVVVLNYNTSDLLLRCVRSVLGGAQCMGSGALGHKATAVGTTFRVLVIDNGSSDDSVERFLEVFPGCQFHKGLPGEDGMEPGHPGPDACLSLYDAGRNAGYVSAYNAAFRHILGSTPEPGGEDAVAILNADLELSAGCLDAMLGCMRSRANIAAVQAKLRSMFDRGSFEYCGAAGGCIDRWGYTYARGRLFHTIERDEGQYDETADIFWSCGACSLIRLQALSECGLLDERFEMHMEEVDLCWRFHLSGWRVLCEPAAVAYHHVSASAPAGSYFRMFFNHRNAVMMVAKNAGRGSLAVSLGGRFFLDALACARSVAAADWSRARAIVSAYAWTGLHAVQIWSARRDVQRGRKVEEAVVLRKMRPTPVALEYFLLGRRTCRELEGGARGEGALSETLENKA